MKTRIEHLLVWILLLGATPLHADVLELKSGSILNGKYMGGTATTVRFDVGGALQVVATSELVALTFTGSSGAAAAPSTPPPAAPVEPEPASAAPLVPTPVPSPPAPAAEPPKPVTLPAGTSLVVRMKDGVSSRNHAGTPFATKLEYDLYAGKVKVLPAGTLLYGVVKSSTQARRVIGQSTLDLRLNQAILPDRKPVTVITSGYAVAGEKAIKDAARGAAAGAAIGAVVDGGDGAATGAAIGAIAGALRRGQTITISPGTMLEFKLTAPLTVTPGK